MYEIQSLKKSILSVKPNPVKTINLLTNVLWQKSKTRSLADFWGLVFMALWLLSNTGKVLFQP